MNLVEQAFAIHFEATKLALKDAIRVCLAEQIVGPDNADDETYNRAIDHCVEAISGLMP